MEYYLEKRIWTEDDFDKMGWHDCLIYCIRFSKDLEFDIDYILQWNEPALAGLPFTFWVAPSTLIFRNVYELAFELDTLLFSEGGFEIESIEQESIENGTVWTIVTQQGDIHFKSDGFQQYIRQEPFYQFGQTISYTERNGISLERTINQDNTIAKSDTTLEKRKKDFEHYEFAKERHLKRQEKEALINSRDKGEIELKLFLLKKKEITELIEKYDYELKDTRFENW